MKLLSDPGAISGHIRKLSGRLDSAAGLFSTFGRPQTLEEVVDEILRRVKSGGDAAVRLLAKEIDGVELPPGVLAVAPVELRGRADVPAVLERSLQLMAERITRYAEAMMPEAERWFTGPGGMRTGVRFEPIERVGAYVPGGLAASTPLFSSVLMNLIPARVAGVKEMVVATPCGPGGVIHPALLRACELAGVSLVYPAGGAQAVAAMAYGTGSCPPCRKIVGPGNAFVQKAKQRLFGPVGMDMIAGPSEVAIIADRSARPAVLAADMISQAEHDPLAAATLFSCDRELLEAVNGEVERLLAGLPRAATARRSLDDFGAICLCASLDECCAWAGELAPEHLELAVEDPASLLPRIRNAGAVFLGKDTPEVAGDYVAGPSHTLPTCGAARHSGGISVFTFLKSVSLIEYDRKGLRADLEAITASARAEGLEGHARAAEARFS